MTTVKDDQTPEEARQRADSISNARYAIDIAVSDDTDAKTFRSTSVIRFDSTASETWVDLDAKAVEITLNGKPIDPASVKDGRVSLTGLHSQDNELRIVADCDYRTTGVGMHRQVDEDGSVYLYTKCEPFDAHRWFGCFDQPDIKGRLTLTVNAPSAWKVITNYPAEPSTPVADDGTTRTVRFSETPPISTYLMAMCAGPFEKLHRTTASGIECGLYVRKSLAKYLDSDFFFKTTEAGLDFYTRRYGRPYPFAKYDQVLVPEFNSGAMENPGCVTFRDSVCVFFGKPTASDYGLVAEFILHEMDHMFFGDEVTLKGWADLWLQESFAEVEAQVSQDAIYPASKVWAQFANGRKAWGMEADQLPSTHPIAPKPVRISQVRDNFDGITYAKGAAALRQLMAYVGEEAYVNGVRSYLADHALGNATLEDFLGALEKSSGRDLHDWFTRWLRTTGMSKLVSSSTVGKDGRYTSFEVVQEHGSGDAVLRPHKLMLGCYSLDGSGKLVRTRQIPVELGTDRPGVSVPELVGVNAPDLVLINDADLTYAKVRLDRRSLKTMLAGIGTIDDPVSRAVGWGIAWDMTRDAQLPAWDYVDTVIRNAPAESEVTVLEKLLGQAATAIDIYGDPLARSATHEKLAGVAKQEMLSSAPGSDRQVIWARAYIANAGQWAELTFIQRLLDTAPNTPSDAVPGLKVDTNLRWNIVKALVARDRLDERAIVREEKADGTDIGRRHALTARALRPTRQAKADAWRKITADQKLSLQDRLALAAGFMKPGQEDLLVREGYLDKYAEFVAKLWTERSPEEGRKLTAGLYPLTLVNDRTTTVVDRLLQRELPEAAKRAVRDLKDGTRRALKARYADIAAAHRRRIFGRGGVGA